MCVFDDVIKFFAPGAIVLAECVAIGAVGGKPGTLASDDCFR